MRLPDHAVTFPAPLRLATLVVAGLLAAVPAAAQQEQAVEFQSFRLPGWSFTPGVALGLVYDTNVALSSPTAALGETQGDSLFTIVPSGQLQFIGKRTDFSAGYRGSLRRYADVDGLDGFDQRSVVGFKHAATKRLTFFARNNFADSPTTDEVEVNGVPFRRTGSRTNTFAAGGDYRLTKFTTATTRYDLTWVDFDRQEASPGLTGGWIHAVGGDLSHQMSQRVSLGGEYTYRTATLDEGARDIGFHNAGGVVRFDLNGQTSASAAAGFGTLNDRTTGESRTGPYVRLGITRSLDRATLGANFEKQYVPSFGFGGASSSQEVRGYVRMPLTMQRLYVQGSAAWRRSIPFEAEALQLDTIWLRSTVGFAATRWARIEALYTFTRQDSIVIGGEVNRHRVGLQFVVSQPVRIQ